jgi:hypothetical protein
MLELIALILLLALCVVVWQELRYRRIRRVRAQDFQRVYHPRDAFHVLVFFKLGRGDRLVPTVRRFVNLLTAASSARLIYAGQAAFTINSKQMDGQDWDGVLLLEYPGREEYQQTCDDYRYSAARGLFADSYYHAMRRNRRVCAGMPRYLLGLRLKDILRGKLRVEPFRPSREFKTFPEFQAWRGRVGRLMALNEINRTGLVVFNLLKFPSPGGEEAVAAVGASLLSRMAALGHGPLHVGRSVALERLARFDRVFVVYYPSARYFADLISSRFYAAAVGFRQPGDALRVPTVPVTTLL